MRWHIYGNDAASGQDVELIVEEADATRAIKTAMDRQIVVGRIEAPKRSSWRRMFALLAWMLFAGASTVCVLLYMQNGATRTNLDQALAEQKRLAGSVALAEHLAAEIRQTGNLAEHAAGQAKELAEELAAARGRMSLTEQQLWAAHQRMDDLVQAAGRVPALEGQLAAANAQLAGAQNRIKADETQAAQLREEIALQARRMDQMEQLRAASTPTAIAARAAEVEKTNQSLTLEIEKLKNELLVTAARSTISASPADATPADASPEATTAPAAGMRWSLRVPFDAARDFLVMHADRESLGLTPGSDGQITSFGLQVANATKLRFVHDRAKERVYDATLMVSLAADAPKDKLAENVKLVGDFVRTFAQGVKDADGIVPAATGQLAELDSERRLVFLGEDCKVTVWNNRQGVYTFKVESARGDVE